MSQVIPAAIDLGIGRGAMADTLDFVRTKARPWTDAGQDRAADDVYTITAIDGLHVRLHATETLLHRAGRVIGKATLDETAEFVVAASIALAETKVSTTEAAMTRRLPRSRPEAQDQAHSKRHRLLPVPHRAASQDRCSDAGCAGSVCSSGNTSKWHAALCPGALTRSSGSSTRQRSNT